MVNFMLSFLHLLGGDCNILLAESKRKGPHRAVVAVS
jgi:hypothetical protein